MQQTEAIEAEGDLAISLAAQQSSESAAKATRVVLLTAPGRAAIATLLVVGPAAAEVVSRLFRPAGKKPLTEQPQGRIVFGRWPAGEVAEEVVVCRTAADRVEINCHGGIAAPRSIASSLVAVGCEELDWRTWTRESLADPLAADAEIALAEAPTERTAQILLDQRRGALRRHFDAICDAIQSGDAAAARLVEELRARTKIGLHLLKPWRVVLAGRPNVGKSSLINALVGYERAIVHSAPGTTRDVVTALTALDGWPVELADTAGLRVGEEPLEAAGIELARQQASAADLLLLVFDRSGTWSEEDESLVASWPHALVVHNKCDLAAASGARPVGIEVSAQSGEGLAELARAIVARLVPHVPEPGEAVPFLAAHIEMLEQVKQRLESGDGPGALAALRGELAASSR
jgi:tRNA modification GTPase